MAQQLVELRPDRHDLGWGLFSNDHVGDLVTVGLPVRFGY
jgi:hypothetical protein